MRSLVSSCVSPRQRSRPTRPSRSSNVRGQSSSVPSRRPIWWRCTRRPLPAARGFDAPEQAGQLLAEGEAPGVPVVAAGVLHEPDVPAARSERLGGGTGVLAVLFLG